MASNIIASKCALMFIILVCAAAQEDMEEFTFGACQPGKESCRDCYLTLVQSLLGNDENVFNLSTAFTAGDLDDPSFVIVNYWFQFNEGHSTVETWLWANSQTYFLQPLGIFQFTSLFFGNPKRFYEKSVDFILNGTECYGAETTHMHLLTKRVS